MEKVSVIIPVYNDLEGLKDLLNSLENQSYKDFEVIVVDDCSTDISYSVAQCFNVKVIKNKKNSGPAYSRNRGIEKAEGEILLFTDSDCVVSRDWISNMVKEFKKDFGYDAVMGKTGIWDGNFFSKCVAQLGFPGGANLGFEKMWDVNYIGLTNHISTCNFGIKRRVFNHYGLFDETFPLPGGEDSEFAYRLKNVVIKYSDNPLVIHEPMTSFKKFIKWQLLRGRSNYHFKQKVGNVSGFIKLRIWSSYNVLRSNMFSIKFPLVFFLLGLSFILQQIGYIMEGRK